MNKINKIGKKQDNLEKNEQFLIFVGPKLKALANKNNI